MPQNPTIEKLAAYFTGPMVAHHSICLQLPVPHRMAAEKFFEIRRDLGIEGYMDKETAIGTITTKLTADT